MKKLIKTIIILILPIILTGCYDNWYKPHGYSFKHAPKTGSPGFKLGFKHGCESGFANNFGGTFYMTFYSWSKDRDLVIENPDIEKLRKRYEKEMPINWDDPEEVKKNVNDYKKVFWQAHRFCRHSVLGTHHASGTMEQGGSWEPTLPGQERYSPGGPKAHTIGNVWSFRGRGNSNLTYW
ncbi:MAG: hypothetical protein O3B09_00535 [Proteobacteria bacterium]|nr:hypothetical protein [Pseudomonadota bacterium]